MSISSVARSCGSRFCVDNVRNAKPAAAAASWIFSAISKNKLADKKVGTVGKVGKVVARTSTRQFSTSRLGQSYPMISRREYSTTKSNSTTTANTDSIQRQKKLVSEMLHKSEKTHPKKKVPANSSKYVGYWLVGSAGLVFGIVILGGLTRLTESGLSITEWKPVTGSIPPISQADWEKEFELYKSSPEFKILNSNITLDEFKFIYYMEWSHRLWGRTIGLVFVLPAAYFVFAKKTSPHVTKRLVLISGLLGLQGFIGWWMVQSGLDHETFDKPDSHPRVSQYRLATHLGAAFLLYIAMINTGLDILRESRWVRNPQVALKEITAIASPIVRPFRKVVFGLACLTFVTSMSGAFVAGLDAGLIYNSFPYMGEGFMPSTNEMFSSQYSTSPSSFNLFWKNMLENPTTVQFNHRVLAVTTWTATLAMHLYSFRYKPFLPRSVIRSGAAAMGFVSLQAALGICTLLWIVPTPLAASHQAGSLAFLTSVLVLLARLRLPPNRIKRLITLLSQTAEKSSKKKF